VVHSSLVTAQAVTPTAAVDRVIEALHDQGALAPETIRSWTYVMGLFGRFMESGYGIGNLNEVDSGLVRAFLEAPSPDGLVPNPSVQHLRRCAVRCLYKTARRLGLAQGDPTLDLELPEWTARRFRPLTDAEVGICRAVAIASSRPLPVIVWALCEATARTGELPALTYADLDLNVGRLWLGGTHSTAARRGQLTDWGLCQLTVNLNKSLDPESPLTPATRRGTAISPSTAVSTVTGILTRAGLDRSMGVRPASVAAWVGRTVFDDTGRIDLVALRCGVRSLDAAARLISWDWCAGE
jgi:hypothetical protein